MTATAIRDTESVNEIEASAMPASFVCQTRYDDLEAVIRITVLCNSIAALALPILISSTRQPKLSLQDAHTLFNSVDQHLSHTIDTFISQTQNAPYEFKTANAYIRQETCVYGACQISRQRDVFRSICKQSGPIAALTALHPNASYAVDQLKKHLSAHSPFLTHSPMPQMVQLAALTTMQPMYYLNAGETGLEIHQTLVPRGN